MKLLAEARDEALAKLAQMEQKLATTLPSAIYTHKILQLEQRVAELEAAARRVCSYHVVKLFGPNCPPLDSPHYQFARDRDALRTLLFPMEPPP